MLCPSVCYTIFRYFDNNWNSVYPLQNFLDELFKLPSNSSNPPLPLPQKWPLISLSLSSFQIFQKYFSFFVLEPLLKPFRTNTQISFHRFSFPFTFLQFFFEIIPNYNCPTILNPVFAGKYSTPFNLFKLSQTPNLLPRMIKKENVWNQKKEKRESCRLLSSSLDRVPPDFHGITSPSRRVFGVVWSQHAVRSFSMHAAGRVRQRGAGRRECDYCNFDEIRATWHERVCPW